MWDFENDYDADLDLGSRRKPVQWVVFAPPLDERDRPGASRRNHSRHNVPSRQGDKGESGRRGGGKTPDEEAATSRRQVRRTRLEDKPPELASGVHGRVQEAVMLEAESDEGNVEYKLRLKQPNPVRFQQLVTQMKFRLSEGNGECFYYIGVEDDGYPRGLSQPDLETSLQTLEAMAGHVHAAVQKLRTLPGCKGRHYLIVRVHKLCADELPYKDLRIAVAGSVDSGKSTLVAVLTNGQKGRPLLDNGQGSARMNVLKHKHEIESGRTSSLSHHTLAYDSECRVLNYAGVAPMTPSEIAAAASKVLRFVDLGGHQRFLKTALYGMTSLLPDYLLLCVCPKAGLTRVTCEHFAISQALEIPVALVITKADVASPAAIAAVLEDVQQLLIASVSATHRAAGTHSEFAVPLYEIVESEQQAARMAAAAEAPDRRRMPVFMLACTTGSGLPALHSFLGRLEAGHELNGTARPPAAAAGSFPSPLGSGSTKQGTETVVQTAGGISREIAAGAVAAGTRRSAGRPGESPPGAPPHFQVDQTFEVRGVGSVVSGTVIAGDISLGQQLLLGPDDGGAFTPVTVTSIQRSQVPVKRIRVGQHATLAVHMETKEGASRPPTEDAAAPVAGPSTAVRRPTAPAATGSEGQCWHGEERKTDRRHDTWREAGGFTAAARVSRSPSSSSDHGDSPRVTLHSQASRRMSAEEALSCQEARQPSAGAAASAAVTEGVHALHVRSPPDLVGGSSDEDVQPDRLAAQPGRWPVPDSMKGTVLLDSSLQPQAVWQFEAVMVLVSGFWPPRGLISGSWPPLRDSDAEENLSDSSLPLDSPAASFDRLRSPPWRNPRAKHRGAYAPVIHCGSIRQAASVVSMTEVLLQQWSAEEASRTVGCDLGPAMAAAASLRGHTRPFQGGELAEGCVAIVTFRFLRRPEWLQEGARLVVRDHTESSTAGAGIVRCVPNGTD